MDTTETRIRIPLDLIRHVLQTRTLRQRDYVVARKAWFGWLDRCGSKRHSISLSEGEKSSMNFVDYQLTVEEISAAKQWVEQDGIDMFNIADDVVREGYRIAFTEDEKNKCVIVTVIGKATDNTNFGCAMSTRHADIHTALMLALYKQVVVFAGGSWGEVGPESQYG